MLTSDTIQKIAPALVEIQKEIENPHKNSENPHFRNKYADLAEIINTMREVCAKHGVTVIQSTGMNGDRCTVTTMLLHTSGEFIRSEAESPLPKQDPQGVGSATTYLRRYSLAAMLCLAQEDDDANTASKGTPKTQRPTPKQTDEPDMRELGIKAVEEWAGLDRKEKEIFSDAISFCIKEATGKTPTGRVADETWKAVTKMIQQKSRDNVDFADLFHAEI